MTPRYKFKRIKKGGKVQKIQSPGVHKMKFKPLTRLQIAKTLQLSHQIYHVTPQFLTLESIRVIVQNGFGGPRHKTKLQNKGLEDVQGEYAVIHWYL